MQRRKAFLFAGLCFILAFVMSRVEACLDELPPSPQVDAGIPDADEGYGYLMVL